MKNIQTFGQNQLTEDAPPPYSVATASRQPSHPLNTAGHVLTNNSGGISNFPANTSSVIGNRDAVVQVTNDLDPLSSVLGNCNRFFLRETGMLDEEQPVVIQIKDDSGRVIMSSMLDLGRSAFLEPNPGLRLSNIRRTITFMHPTSGDVVMTARDMGGLMTITSGNRVLGMVDGCKEFDPNIVPKDLTGAELCSVVQGGLVRKFIAKNGSELGKAGYFDRSGVFEIRLSPGLDVKTKATLLLTGYCIFVLHYATTEYGKIGTAGALTKRGCCGCTFVIVVFIVVFLVGKYAF